MCQHKKQTDKQGRQSVNTTGTKMINTNCCYTNMTICSHFTVRNLSVCCAGSVAQ